MADAKENAMKKIIQGDFIEGMIKKGGLNLEPSTLRPTDPPKAQSPKPPTDQAPKQEGNKKK